MPPIHLNPLTVKEGREISRLCDSFKWKSNTFGMQLAGWIFLARVAGALAVRPHVWITGGKGTGKSTLMESLIAPLLGSPKGKLHLIGASTEAGIRQAVKASALPIIFDEFEATGAGSAVRIEAILELLRNSWSTSQGKVLKGSATGASVEYQLTFAALLSSIRVRLDNDADRSRFSVLELDRHSDDPEEWSRLRGELAKITEETGERLFARACAMVPMIIACQRILAPHFARAVSQRYAQQVGTLIAAWWCLENDQLITDEQAVSIVADMCAEPNDEEGENISDEKECLLTLLTTKLTLQASDGKPLIISFVEAIRNEILEAQLMIYGVKRTSTGIMVANKHAELSKIYRGTRWAENWSRSLRRLTDSIASNNAVSFGSRKSLSRGVFIPDSHLV